MPTQWIEMAHAGADSPAQPRGAVTVILGIGNTLLADEGAGIHVIDRLRAEGGLDDGVDLVDGGTLSFFLARTIEDADKLIVVDAAEMGVSPGSVRVYEGEQMDAFLGSNRKRSVHEVGLIDLMAMAALAGRLPERRALIGIQPKSVDWSVVPSAPVAEAIPKACKHAFELLEKWQG